MNTDAEGHAGPLQKLLQRELGHVARFVDILEQEHAALSQRDLVALERVIAEKRALVAELQLAGREREKLTAGNGARPQNQDVEDEVPPAPMLIPALWEQLQALARKARQLSEVNASIIELSRRHVERALAILQGREAEVQIYDPTARTNRSPRSHSLAKA